MSGPITILDGPLGTELLARGVPTPLPGWSAHALESATDVVRQIHADYAAAGAAVHTANTFRTQPRRFPETWRDLLETAVRLAREGTGRAGSGGADAVRAGAGGRASAGAGRLIAGSIAPLEDCYSPEQSPADPRPGHRRIARALADTGVDLLLVETFPHVGEALVATEEAIATGLPTWVSFTAGPDADLLTPGEIRDGARRATELGVEAVLLNCIPTHRSLEFLEPLRDLRVRIGVYANAGAAHDEVGFTTAPIDPAAYADAARSWVAAGASIVGGCCGTGVAHVRELARRFAGP